jgi:hypothetical protein
VVRLILSGAVIVAFGVWPILGGEASAAPDATAAPPLEAEAVSVTGTVQKRCGDVEGSKWEPLRQGETLGERMLVRTGLGSQLVLRFADRSEVTIRAATKAGIAEFAKSGEHVRAKVGVKYGSLRIHVDSSKGTNDFKVALPSATLSIRGSAASVGSFEAGAGFNQTQGSAMVAFLGGLEQLIAAGEQTGNKKGLSRDLVEQILAIGKTDPRGLTPAERRIAERLIQGGSTLGAGSGQNTIGPKLTQFIYNRWSQYGVVWAGSGNWVRTSELGGTWTGSGIWQNSGGGGLTSWVCTGGTWQDANMTSGGPAGDTDGGWSGAITGSGTYTNADGSGTWTGVFNGSGTGSENPEVPNRGAWQGSGTGLVQQTPSVGGKD